MSVAKAVVPAILFCSVSILNIGGTQTPASQETRSPDLKRLVSWLAGSFSSQEQAEADTDYADIRLHMVPIWTHRSDGYWLYVEQAAASKLDRPYRQRVNHVTQRDDSTVESAVYTMPSPLRFAGEWRKAEPLAALTPDSLVLRDGCTVLLRVNEDGVFQGQTVGTGCPSELRGAAYATSEVLLTDTAMISWDRGFDRNGNQVWGAVKGGYVFKKVESYQVR